MDPVIAQALATLITAFATAVLMAAGFYWGPTRRSDRNEEKEKRTRKKSGKDKETD